MKLVFRTLVLTDFKEYIGKHVLQLARLGLGVHFVRGVNEVNPALGSNGASKSTLFDALRWCLFGSTVKGLKNPDVKTWGGSKPARVKLIVDVDGERHTIIRSTKTNGLTIDDEHASQEAVEKLIRMSPAMFDHTLLMGQGEALFLDLGPTPKLNVLSDTLELDRWERRSGEAKARAEMYDKRIADYDNQKCNLEQHLNTLDDDLRDARQQMQDWERERADRESERDAKIKELQKQEKAVDLEWGKWDLAYDGAETELRASRKRQQDLIDARNDLVTQEAKLAVKLSAVESSLELARDRGTCPTCGQKIKGEHKHDLKAKRREAKELGGELHDVSTRAEATAEQIEKVKKEIRGFIDKSNDAQDKLTHATNRRERIKAELAALTKNAHSDGERENPHSKNVAKARNLIREAKALLIVLEKRKGNAHKKSVRARYWVSGFKQLRLYLLQEALDELEAVTNAMLPTVGLDGWRITYDIERENKSGKVTSGLTVAILKPDMNKPVRWESWSGGEAQRLRLVGSIALSEMLLRRAGVECDLLILDEPTQHLSPEGVKDTADLLCDRGEFNQVWYIDHQAVESNRFASVLTVTKNSEGASFHVEA
jgi:DNA repair exonuclease SbcCD ATPase subunit